MGSGGMFALLVRFIACSSVYANCNSLLGWNAVFCSIAYNMVGSFFIYLISLLFKFLTAKRWAPVTIWRRTHFELYSFNKLQPPFNVVRHENLGYFSYDIGAFSSRKCGNPGPPVHRKISELGTIIKTVGRCGRPDAGCRMTLQD